MNFKFGNIIASNKDKIDNFVETLIHAERTIADFIEQKFQPKNKKLFSAKVDEYDERTEYESEFYEAGEEHPFWEDIEGAEEVKKQITLRGGWVSTNDESPVDKGFVFLRKKDGEEVIGQWQIDMDPHSADIEYYQSPDFEWLCDISDVTHWRPLTEREAKVLDLPRSIEEVPDLPDGFEFDSERNKKSPFF